MGRYWVICSWHLWRAVNFCIVETIYIDSGRVRGKAMCIIQEVAYTHYMWVHEPERILLFSGGRKKSSFMHVYIAITLSWCACTATARVIYRNPICHFIYASSLYNSLYTLSAGILTSSFSSFTKNIFLLNNFNFEKSNFCDAEYNDRANILRV